MWPQVQSEIVIACHRGSKALLLLHLLVCLSVKYLKDKWTDFNETLKK